MSKQKILHLTLKKKWFDMILSGEKKEEYREVKPYWITRLSGKWEKGDDGTQSITPSYDQVLFTNGYGKNAPQMLVELTALDIGNAKPEWSDNWQGDVFKIKLGNIIETKNIK